MAACWIPEQKIGQCNVTIHREKTNSEQFTHEVNKVLFAMGADYTRDNIPPRVKPERTYELLNRPGRPFQLHPRVGGGKLPHDGFWDAWMSWGLLCGRFHVSLRDL